MDLALNNLQRLICHKKNKQTNKQINIIFFIASNKLYSFFLYPQAIFWTGMTSITFTDCSFSFITFLDVFNRLLMSNSIAAFVHPRTFPIRVSAPLPRCTPNRVNLYIQHLDLLLKGVKFSQICLVSLSDRNLPVFFSILPCFSNTTPVTRILTLTYTFNSRPSTQQSPRAVSYRFIASIVSIIIY